MQARAFAVPAAIASCLVGTALACSAPGPASDVLRFVVPGLGLAWVSRWLPAPAAPGRIGAWLLLFSALAFAMQGVFAFDPADPDALASRMRALAWTLWWIAFAPGALLQAFSRGAGFIAASLAAIVLVCVPAMLPIPRTAMPFAQGVAMATWFAWWWWAASRRAALSRGAA